MFQKTLHFFKTEAVFIFWREKTGDGKNFWRQEGGMPILLDAIERESICNVTDKSLHKWSSLLSSSMKDVFVIND